MESNISSLDSWATFFRHAIVLFGIGSSTAGFLAFWHRKNETRQREFQVSAIVLGFLVVGSAALNFNFTDKVTRIKDEEFQSFKYGKEIEIKNLERGNIELRKQTSDLEKQNLEQAKEVAGLQIKVADAKRRQAEAETKLAKVAQRQQPRHERFYVDQFAARLKTGSPGKAMVWYRKTDPGSILFAMGLISALQDAGWTNMGHKAVESTVEHGTSSGDIDFVMRDSTVFQTPPVQCLFETLKAFGYIVGGGFIDPTLPPDALRIVIQPKP